jgi:hypothetical protein
VTRYDCGVHRGVQAVLSWIAEHPSSRAVRMGERAQAADITAIEDATRSPLPSDLKILLGCHDGGSLPSGTLLRVGAAAEHSILGELAKVAERLGRPASDPELPLPFFVTAEGSWLAFDRGAGPVADTWPIVDCPPDGQEIRLVHRTFDGWCRLLLAEWTSDDFGAEFTLDRYLRAGQRHAEVEPDVAAAHATVGHAQKRSGQPELALRSYLAAGRCVPPLPFCDWEALKLALLLHQIKSAYDAAKRLCARAPSGYWRQRGATPLQVADLLGHLVAEIDPPEPLLRLLDQLAEQAPDKTQADAISQIRRAVFNGDALPATHPVRATAVAPQDDAAGFWSALEGAYREGAVREEDLLLDVAYRPLQKHRPLADILRVRRDF